MVKTKNNTPVSGYAKRVSSHNFSSRTQQIFTNFFRVYYTMNQGWKSRDKSRSRDLSRDLNFKVSVSRLGEKFGSRSRSNWISVSQQKLRLESSFIGTALQLFASCQRRSRASMLITESKPISLLRHFLSDADP